MNAPLLYALEKGDENVGPKSRLYLRQTEGCR